MKFGEAFENESVPEWSLHNIDYTGLKDFIKVRTTKDQATAITIPGQQDNALGQFEDELYIELCRQHDRVGLFVSSKADELTRRLQHLSGQLHSIILRCTTSSRSRMSQKRQRRLAKYHRDITQCGDEIRDLMRFVNAQAVAFRKILKKYMKWTGSRSLSSRFKEGILSDPKSFTRRDFQPLTSQVEDLLASLRAVTPADSMPTTPGSHPATPFRGRSIQFTPTEMRAATRPALLVQTPYWNEYDDGSEAGDVDGGYVIYMDADEEYKFPRLLTWFSVPINKAKAWISGRHDETEPLLPSTQPSAARARGYGATGNNCLASSPGGSASSPTAANTTDGEEDAFASDSEFPSGYRAFYATLPSVDEQRMNRYREHVIFWATIGSFAASFVFLGVAAILVTTGRHHLRVEVDAGATVGVVASLTCACAALGLVLAKKDPMGLVNRLAIWITFATVCMLNGMILVLVVGNQAL